MQAIARLVPGISLEFVEFRVFLVLDLGLTPQPEGIDGVDDVAVQLDRELDEARVPLDDFLNVRVTGELLVLVLQENDDFRSSSLTFGFLDLVFTCPGACPNMARLFLPR